MPKISRRCFIATSAAPISAMATARSPVSSGAQAAGSSSNLKAALERAIDSRFAAYKQGVQPGVHVSIVKDDQLVVSKNFGMSVVEGATPWTDHTVAAVASLTKQFTAALLLRLAEKNIIGLDEEISPYLSDYPPFEGFTFRNCMAGTTGAPDDEGLAWFSGRHHRTPTSLDWQAELIANAPRLRATPGDDFVYNNAGPRLALRAAETAAGASAEKLFDDYLFTPLDMEDTRLVRRGSFAAPGRSLTYYLDSSGSFRHHTPYMELSADGGAMSTPADLRRWIRFLLSQEGQRIATELSAPAVLSDGRESPYGLGSFRGTVKGSRWFGHSGGGAGESMALVVPDEALGVTILGNRSDIRPRLHSLEIADIALSVIGRSGPRPLQVQQAGEPRLYVDSETGMALSVAELPHGRVVSCCGRTAYLRESGGRWQAVEGSMSVRLEELSSSELRVRLFGRTIRATLTKKTTLSTDSATALAGSYFSPDIGARLDIVKTERGATALVAGGPDHNWRVPLSACGIDDVFLSPEFSMKARNAGKNGKITSLVLHGRAVVGLHYRRSTDL